jgi:hypothetical protein
MNFGLTPPGRRRPGERVLLGAKTNTELGHRDGLVTAPVRRCESPWITWSLHRLGRFISPPSGAVGRTKFDDLYARCRAGRSCSHRAIDGQHCRLTLSQACDRPPPGSGHRGWPAGGQRHRFPGAWAAVRWSSRAGNSVDGDGQPDKDDSKGRSLPRDRLATGTGSRPGPEPRRCSSVATPLAREDPDDVDHRQRAEGDQTAPSG